MSEVDYVEVGRAAHELFERHGRNASDYAAKLAQQYVDDGDKRAASFWKAVSASLKVRGDSLGEG